MWQASKLEFWKILCVSFMYLWWQGRATYAIVGLALHMGHNISSPSEPEDLSFENRRKRLFIEDELRIGSSSNNISENSFHDMELVILLCNISRFPSLPSLISVMINDLECLTTQSDL